MIIPKKIKIAGKIISDEKCFIIAEAGINHNGNFKLAKKLVDEAKKAGADAVKFQTFKTENLISEKTRLADYQKENLKEKINQFEMLKKYELKKDDFSKLKEYSDSKGIIFLSTPHSNESIDFLDSLVPAYKIGSGDLNNHPFLKIIAGKNKPIILSTGMATLKEIKEAVNVIRRGGNNHIIVLHCTTSYPCPLEDVNLLVIKELKEKLKLPIGYSDHTSGIITPIIARSLGAVVIEKHFTLNKNFPGPDHKASLEPKQLKKMVEEIRKTELILGSKEKKPTKKEEKIKKLVRKSIFVAEKIEKGEKITRKKLSIKRPGNGIEPKFLEKIIGKISLKSLKKGHLLSFKDLN